MADMQGYDRQSACEYICKYIDKKQNSLLVSEIPALIPRLIDAHLDYLHLCGALDESGDTGEGEYDEDEAFEFLLDRIASGNDKRMDALATLVECFLLLQDEYMEQAGLLG